MVATHLEMGFFPTSHIFPQRSFMENFPTLELSSGESVHSGPSSIRLEAQILWNFLFDVPLDFIKPRYFRDVDPRDYDA